MSNGDDEETPAEDESDSATEAITEEDLTERLDDAEAALEAAETEADLDAIEADLDEIETDIEAADLPEPDDEDEQSPAEALDERLSELRDELESQRGPYASEAIEAVESAAETITDTRWTDTGEDEVIAAVATFAAEIEETLDASIETDVSSLAATDEVLSSAVDAIEAADLDADEDTETIASLLEATGTLEDDLEAAEEWDDLETREQLQAQGFYDILGHYKDYPPEWSALKEYESRGNVEMILLALESFQSDFMERHCLEALERMGKRAATDEAIETMLQRANKRDKPAIRILGKMGAEDAVETLVEYVDEDSNPALQKVTFKALGEIGDASATQPLADKLVMDNGNVRPHAARALGLIGDTRAIDPLADTLRTDENDNVRASAAWALRQIGTKRALERVVDLESDSAFIVDTEIQKATEELNAAAASA
ncbi:HEAT repeat domain-containing protein [Halalkalirubrum salinum]|uniref:HEAT repeat domain-containing protein n=1 Tax=Halalkalirubrum salinum TaxID=2563889 RepID=UPI0010FB5E1E|nr:HEAT repeat domain-containing protein [Halalkalirubrum salinum]